MQRTYRSGVATILMWVGPLVAVVPSIVFVILPLALLATGAGPSTLLMLVVVPIAVIAGALLFLSGLRSTVTIGVDAVSWRTLSSGARTFPYSAVRQVEIPTGRRGPRSVRLHLMDGSVASIGSLTMSGGEGGNTPDRQYLRVGSEIASAHQEWWRHHQR